MGLEIERKFLVEEKFLPELSNGQYIIQGYLSEKPALRFRTVNNKIILTLKEFHADGSRFELETEKDVASREELEYIKKIALYPVLEKIRYRLPSAELIWEVDVYQKDNAGLITADVEIPYINYPISFPCWINPLKDISNNAQYFNINLTRNPYCQWKLKSE